MKKNRFHPILIIVISFFLYQSTHAQDLIPYLNKNGKYIYINKKTQIKEFDKEFCRAEFFENGVALVEIPNDSKRKYINRSGKIIFQDYRDVQAGEELFLVKTDNKLYGFCDKEGNVVIPITYSNASPFKDGLAAVKKDRKWGYIDKTGAIKIPFKFDMASDFDSGVAKVCIGNWSNRTDKYGYIDKTGKEVIPIIYTFLDGFHEGLATANKSSYDPNSMTTGFINRVGKEVIPFKFSSCYSFSNGLVKVKDSKKGFIFINKQGEFVINADSLGAYFKSGLTHLRKNNKIGFVNETGKIIIEPIYDEATEFNQGFSIVKINEKYGIIDTRGKVIIPISHESIYDTKVEGVFSTYNGKKYYIDVTGKEYKDEGVISSSSDCIGK
jgi:hypothetical protein